MAGGKIEATPQAIELTPVELKNPWHVKANHVAIGGLFCLFTVVLAPIAAILFGVAAYYRYKGRPPIPDQSIQNMKVAVVNVVDRDRILHPERMAQVLLDAQLQRSLDCARHPEMPYEAAELNINFAKVCLGPGCLEVHHVGADDNVKKALYQKEALTINVDPLKFNRAAQIVIEKLSESNSVFALAKINLPSASQGADPQLRTWQAQKRVQTGQFVLYIPHTDEERAPGDASGDRGKPYKHKLALTQAQAIVEALQEEKIGSARISDPKLAVINPYLSLGFADVRPSLHSDDGFSEAEIEVVKQSCNFYSKVAYVADFPKASREGRQRADDIAKLAGPVKAEPISR